MADNDIDTSKWSLTPSSGGDKSAAAPAATAPSADVDPKKWSLTPKPKPGLLSRIGTYLSTPPDKSSYPEWRVVGPLSKSILDEDEKAGRITKEQRQRMENWDPSKALQDTPLAPLVDIPDRAQELYFKHPYYAALIQAGLMPAKAGSEVLEATMGPKLEAALGLPEKYGSAIIRRIQSAGMGTGSLFAGGQARDWSHELFPNHPKIADAIGTAVTLGAAPTMETYLGPKLADVFTGTDFLEAEKAKTEEKARTEHAQLRQKTDEAASKETQTEAKKAADVGEKAGQKALGQRTDFMQKAAADRQAEIDRQKEETDKIKAGQAEALHKQQLARDAEQAKIEKQAQKARDKHAKKLRDDAAKDAIQQEVDAANQDRQGKPVFDNTMPPGEPRNLRDRIFRRATKAPVTAYRENWRAERDEAIPETIKDERPANYDPLIQQMDEEQNGQRDEQGNVISTGWKERPVSKQVGQMFDRVREMIKPTPPDAAKLLELNGEDPAKIKGIVEAAQIAERNRAHGPDLNAEPTERERAAFIHRTEELQPPFRFTPEQAQAQMMHERMRGASEISPEELKIRDALAKWHEKNPPASIRDLLKVQREIKQAILKEPNPTNQTALDVINYGIDLNIRAHVDSLPPERVGEANLQRLQTLNETYFNHRNNFRPSLERRLNQFERPVDASNLLLTQHPQAALELIHHSTTLDAADAFGTRMELRDQIAANVQERGAKWINNVDQKVLDALFPEGSDLRNKDSWIRNDQNIRDAAAAIEANPRLKQTFLNNIEKEVGDGNRRLAAVTVKAARQDAHLLGKPLEQTLLYKLREAENAPPDVLLRNGASSNVEYAARVASQFYKDALTHHAAELPQIPDTPEQQLAQQPLNVQNPGFAAQAAEQTYPQETKAREAAQTARQVPESEMEKAAVTQQFQTGYQMRGMFKRWLQRAQIWGTVLAAMPLMNRQSGYAMAGMAGFAAMTPTEVLYAGVRKSMENPKTAEAVERILSNPTKYMDRPNALTTAIARSVLTSGMAVGQADQEDRAEYERWQDVSKSVEEYAMPLNAPTPTATPTPGPGVSAADRMRSEAIAPSHASATDAHKLAMNVSKPTPVDITHDLASGRHSVDEIKQTLKMASDPRASSVLSGMPLKDAVMAAELATPEEREAMMPVLEQRMRQELPREKNRTTQANLTQRMKQLQSMGETAIA